MANISNIKVLQGNALSLSGSTVQVTGALFTNGAVTTNGNLTVNGTITANQLNINVTTVSSSVIYSSGSTKFGDTADDTMQVTGSMLVNGNIVLASGFAITGSHSGSGAGLTNIQASSIVNIGTIATTAVTAGNGLTGGGTVGSLTLDVGSGTGILVSADAVSIDPSIVVTITGSQTISGAKTFNAATTTFVAVTGTTAQFTSVTASFTGSGAGLTSLNGSQITTGVVGVTVGGTGQTTYTDGQLLIGNSSGNTLTKNTLTAGAGIGITNGNGTITIAVTGAVGSITSISGGANIGITNPTGPNATVSLSSSLSNLTAVTGGNFLVTASLIATSSLAVSRATINAPYTVNSRDNFILGNVTSSADLIVGLPLPTAIDGRTLTIKRIDDPLNAGALQISCSVNIDNANIFNLYGPYQAVTLIADSGSNKWFVV